MNRHRDSERSTGKEQMKNQEWYCTSTVVAQTTIVFNTSIQPEATHGERVDLRVNQTYHTHKTRKRKNISHFQLDGASRECSKQIDDNCRFNQELCAGKERKKSNTTLCHIRIRRCMLNRTATWNDMKFQKSSIVCNAKNAQDTRDQTRKALPKRPRSKQSNASAVDTSCTSLSFMMQH